MLQVLFVELKLPPSGDPTNPHPHKTLGPARRSARGRVKAQYSTAKDVLEKLKPLHPLPRRNASSIYSIYPHTYIFMI